MSSNARRRDCNSSSVKVLSFDEKNLALSAKFCSKAHSLSGTYRDHGVSPDWTCARVMHGHTEICLLASYPRARRRRIREGLLAHTWSRIEWLRRTTSSNSPDSFFLLLHS